MAQEIGLTAVLKPRLDEQQARQTADRMSDLMESARDVTPAPSEVGPPAPTSTPSPTPSPSPSPDGAMPQAESTRARLTRTVASGLSVGARRLPSYAAETLVEPDARSELAAAKKIGQFATRGGRGALNRVRNIGRSPEEIAARAAQTDTGTQRRTTVTVLDEVHETLRSHLGVSTETLAVLRDVHGVEQDVLDAVEDIQTPTAAGGEGGGGGKSGMLGTVGGGGAAAKGGGVARGGAGLAAKAALPLAAGAAVFGTQEYVRRQPGGREIMQDRRKPTGVGDAITDTIKNMVDPSGLGEHLYGDALADLADRLTTTVGDAMETGLDNVAKAVGETPPYEPTTARGRHQAERQGQQPAPPTAPPKKPVGATTPDAAAVRKPRTIKKGIQNLTGVVNDRLSAVNKNIQKLAMSGGSGGGAAASGAGGLSGTRVAAGAGIAGVGVLASIARAPLGLAAAGSPVGGPAAAGPMVAGQLTHDALRGAGGSDGAPDTNATTNTTATGDESMTSIPRPRGAAMIQPGGGLQGQETLDTLRSIHETLGDGFGSLTDTMSKGGFTSAMSGVGQAALSGVSGAVQGAVDAGGAAIDWAQENAPDWIDGLLDWATTEPPGWVDGLVNWATVDAPDWVGGVVEWATVDAPGWVEEKLTAWANTSPADWLDTLVGWADAAVPDWVSGTLKNWADAIVPDWVSGTLKNWADAIVPDWVSGTLKSWAETTPADWVSGTLDTWAEVTDPSWVSEKLDGWENGEKPDWVDGLSNWWRNTTAPGWVTNLISTLGGKLFGGDDDGGSDPDPVADEDIPGQLDPGNGGPGGGGGMVGDVVEAGEGLYDDATEGVEGIVEGAEDAYNDAREGAEEWWNDNVTGGTDTTDTSPNTGRNFTRGGAAGRGGEEEEEADASTSTSTSTSTSPTYTNLTSGRGTTQPVEVRVQNDVTVEQQRTDTPRDVARKVEDEVSNAVGEIERELQRLQR